MHLRLTKKVLGFPCGSDCKESAIRRPSSIPGSGRSPGERNGATHSGIPAWRILWTEKPGGLQLGCKESDTTEQLTLS